MMSNTSQYCIYKPLKQNIMTLFENAQKFFHNCESAKGWGACAAYVEGDGKLH